MQRAPSSKQQTHYAWRPFSRRASTPARLSCGAVLPKLKWPGRSDADFDLVRECHEAPELWQRLRDAGLPDQFASLQNVQGAGRGLVAEVRIKKGQPLLSVPQSACLTASKARALLDPALLQALPPQLPAWTVLALALCALRHARSVAKRSATGATAAQSGLVGGALAPWGSYLDVLPSTTGCVLEWEPALVEELRKTSAAEQAGEILAAATTSWAEVAGGLAQAAQAGVVSRDAFTERGFRWGLSILLSRVIRLRHERAPDSGAPAADVEALVPWADFINHSATCTSHIVLDAGHRLSLPFMGPGDGGGTEGGTVVLTADRDYLYGQQVFASYGEKPSGELLLSYGFMPKPGTNPYDAIRMTVALDEGADMRAEKGRVLRELGIPASQTFPLRRSGYPTTLLPYVAFMQLRREHCGSSRDLGRFGHKLLVENELPNTELVDTFRLARDWLFAYTSEWLDRLEQTRKQDDSRERALLDGTYKAVGAFESASDSLAAAAVGEGNAPTLLAPQKQANRRSVHTGLLTLEQHKYIEAAIAAIRVEEGRILRRTQYEMEPLSERRHHMRKGKAE